MSVTSGATIWAISCDRPCCTSQIAVAAASCSQALIDAEHEGWHVLADGTAYCPTHRPRE
ncbi:hypothetical protein [Bifidobacterium pseudocatenulatum]|uniref:hypothetical protein n=1 Tax=Bifidobacterium pseudocatenulatum TaxID=28026 RepID=UPI0010719E5E|nr:hypothetical protein [Bifidobacterium pseudocatenulatum]DAF32336.1 MAG TPA: hypothetical protein [Caudoviricetes sp.]DAZ34138.1 MAG TPA: hypothetical protein [Caudoviricetes sp.]